MGWTRRVGRAWLGPHLCLLLRYSAQDAVLLFSDRHLGPKRWQPSVPTGAISENEWVIALPSATHLPPSPRAAPFPFPSAVRLPLGKGEGKLWFKAQFKAVVRMQTAIPGVLLSLVTGSTRSSCRCSARGYTHHEHGSEQLMEDLTLISILDSESLARLCQREGPSPALSSRCICCLEACLERASLQTSIGARQGQYFTPHGSSHRGLSWGISTCPEIAVICGKRRPLGAQTLQHVACVWRAARRARGTASCPCHGPALAPWGSGGSSVPALGSAGAAPAFPSQG